MTLLPGTEAHPHARAVLAAALAAERPSHAYLFAGPAGSGKRAVAQAFAAALLARGAPDPENARLRVAHGVHPDLTWVAPSGAREMLVGDIDEAVVAAASHTPFEARFRVFVLERAHTLRDEAANRLLKTLEEPGPHVVLVLLADRPADLLPTIRSRCQEVRFDPAPPAALAERLALHHAVAPPAAAAAARLALGDGERALQLSMGEGLELRMRAEAFARAPLTRTSATARPWEAMIKAARRVGDQQAGALTEELANEKAVLPKKEHRKKEREYEERTRRAVRRAETEALDQGVQLAGLWYRDLACVVAGAEDLVLHADRLDELRADAAGRDLRALGTAVDLVEQTRVRFTLNVDARLALEALAYRLEAVV